MAMTPKTPGVSISEVDAFPSSIVGVETAVPAFIGYTATAAEGSKDLLFTPVRIASMADYAARFGGAFAQTYYLAPVPAAVSPADHAIGSALLGGSAYDILRMGGAGYNFYQSLRLFYQNGGGDCYVLSCGTYGTGAPPPPVSRDDLLKGLDAVAGLAGPTLLVVPDAILLDQTSGQDPAGFVHPHFDSVAVAMLNQCLASRDRLAIIDAWLDLSADPKSLSIAATADSFRAGLAAAPAESLRYGAAYFPALATSIVDGSEVGLVNFDLGPANLATLTAALKAAALWTYPDTGPGTADPRYTSIADSIDGIGAAAADPSSLARLSRELAAGLPSFQDLLETIAASLGVLPASGAMAGIFVRTDEQKGVWIAPANVGIAAVVAPTVPVGDAAQQGLNAPVDGKAINAIRSFPSRGTLVWGARTLDGNSLDWRYIQVSRTMIYIEQSIKQALEQFAFAPNAATTWVTVVSMVESFLHGLWAAGGLMGGTPADAYSVQCGIGSTMTGQDLLDGTMVVQVALQMTQPAEFMTLIFKQKMLAET